MCKFITLPGTVVVLIVILVICVVLLTERSFFRDMKDGGRNLAIRKKKMSKSDENPNASVYLMDDPDTIMRKFKRAVTDSEAQVIYRDEQPGIKNLIDIYSACTGKTHEEVEKEFDGKGYGDFKLAVGESVVSGIHSRRADRNQRISF